MTYKFAQILFDKLQEMVEQGIIPRKLVKCDTLACLYGKSIKKK